MLWQYYELTLIMKNDAKKCESTSSWHHYDVIFGMTSRATPENQENRIFALDFLKIVARCRLTPHFFCFLKFFQKKHLPLQYLAKNIGKSWNIDFADFADFADLVREMGRIFPNIGHHGPKLPKMWKTKFWSLKRPARAHFAEFTIGG